MLINLRVERKKLNLFIEKEILPKIPELLALRLVFVKHRIYVELDLDLTKLKKTSANGNLLPNHLDIQVIFESGHIIGDKLEFVIVDFLTNHREDKITLLKIVDNLFEVVRREIISEVIKAEPLFSAPSDYKSIYLSVPRLFAEIPALLQPEIKRFKIENSQLIFSAEVNFLLYMILKFSPIKFTDLLALHEDESYG